MKQLREKFIDMEKKFGEASLLARSPEFSSPSNPSPQYSYTSQRGRGRHFQTGRGSQYRGRGFYENRGRGGQRGGYQHNQNSADKQTSDPTPTPDPLN